MVLAIVILVVVALGGLLGAIAWNLVTWTFGLPSSSHALIGGLVGFGLAFLVMLAIMWVFRARKPARTNRGFRLAQTVSAAAMALGHACRTPRRRWA